jgi:triosephosphate isomerase
MRKKIVAANWKMNMTQAESASFVETFLRELGESQEVEVVLVPPFTAIAKVTEALGAAQNVKVGAQNMHWERSGAFTGEISSAMLRDLFVRYVVLGHSDGRTRRRGGRRRRRRGGVRGGQELGDDHGHARSHRHQQVREDLGPEGQAGAFRTRG